MFENKKGAYWDYNGLNMDYIQNFVQIQKAKSNFVHIKLYPNIDRYFKLAKKNSFFNSNLTQKLTKEHPICNKFFFPFKTDYLQCFKVKKDLINALFSYFVQFLAHILNKLQQQDVQKS